MSNKKDNMSLQNKDKGFLINLTRQAMLIFRLMGDSRVSFFAKLFPVGALAYFVFPDPFPIIDDAIILGVGTYMFIEMCPTDVVAEHQRALWGEPAEETPPGEVIDADFVEEE
jgi:hypothetical protein